MTVAIRKLCLLCSFGRRYMFIAASCSYTHTLPYNHHRCSSVPSECDAALQFLCNGLQSTSFAMGCNYKVHCSFMQLLTLPYKHRPYLNVTVMLQCSSCAIVWTRFALQPPPMSKCDCDAAMQFLCNGLEEDFAVKRHAGGDAGSELDLLVQSSGKMLLLHKLLPKLKAEGHKVHIFILTLNPKHKPCVAWKFKPLQVLMSSPSTSTGLLADSLGFVGR